MKKIFSWIYNNVSFLITLFLLAFIPLYPKRPLLDIRHTWVYIRVEDFVVAFVLSLWIILLFRKKVTLKTPLTLPIILFWIIGGLATLHGVLLIFPRIAGAGVFSNVAFLSYLRKIEYMSLFFVAYNSIKDKSFTKYVIAALAIVLILIVGYGFGQKWLGLPAYLTMNEEFAKGVPIQISQLGRVPSTFAGHYDLAAYLVLVIPLFISIAMSLRNWILKILLLVTSALGFSLLFMTVSRVSFFVLLLALGLLLMIQKKKIFIISLIVMNLVLLSFFPSLLNRFGSTITEIDVLVDAKTGQAIGNVKLTSSDPFKDKVIVRREYENQRAVFGISREDVEETITASTSAIVPLAQVPQSLYLLVEPNAPTGENLPQGTGYINLQLSPIKDSVSRFFYELKDDNAGEVDRVVAFYGNFLIKRAKAYDLSYTTRFQGEWPRTIEAFRQNIFLGSGYGSVSLAVDNNYLRILGESGVLGLGSFLLVFLVAGIYIRKILPDVDSPIVRSLTLGFVAGTFGLSLNAVLIDVFEASKIAFTYWLLMGVILGILQLYRKREIHVLEEVKKVLTSVPLGILYLFILVVVLFLPSVSNYFVGDDFTWLRWATEGNPMGYFTESNGFFYRPGTKLYFYLMQSAFWLNQNVYHFVSIGLHFIFASLLFLITRKIVKNHFYALATALLFLVLSSHAEGIFWIAATGHLFNAVFVLLSLLFYMHWKEKKNILLFILSFLSIVISLLFYELGVVAPLLVVLYDLIFWEKSTFRKMLRNPSYYILLFPILPYLFLRFVAGSHWFSGDYSYNILKLPFNFAGNAIGYFFLTLTGPAIMPFYQSVRSVLREHVLFTLPIVILLIIAAVFGYRIMTKKIQASDRRIVLFGLSFFIISLLPFIALGNIASRYSYLSSVGVVLILVFLLKKAYMYLKNISDKSVAIASVTTFVIVFVSSNLFQIQQLHLDWHAAGERAERVLISLNEFYSDDWRKNSATFYFVAVPAKYGDAWIFPVGLRDAVWFVFRNEKIVVNQVQTEEEALANIQDPLWQKAFKFDDGGRLIEIEAPRQVSETIKTDEKK